MTLIVAIKCSDGIVLGADGAATLGSMGQQTVKQAVKKLTIIDQRLVVGVSGPVGLGQRIKGVIGDMWAAKKFAAGAQTVKPYMAMTLVREQIGPHLQQELHFAGMSQPLIGHVALASALTSTVLAMPLGQQLALFQFDQQGAPEEATDDLPFIAIGSGQKSADPFLAFLRRVFWRKGLPTLAAGTFATYWALDYAIKGEPGGVSEPIQMVTIRRDGQHWKAIEITEAELDEHQQGTGEAEKYLSTFRRTLEAPAAGEELNPPPAPPAKPG